jgi:hypothetical protein
LLAKIHKVVGGARMNFYDLNEFCTVNLDTIAYINISDHDTVITFTNDHRVYATIDEGRKLVQFLLEEKVEYV